MTSSNAGFPQIRALRQKDLPALKKFTDQVIGQGYYSEAELEDIFKRSFAGHIMCTFVLEIDGHIRGMRITFPPGQWSHGKGEGLTPSKWPHALSETAYFQSLFLDPTLTSQGFGKKMSLLAMETLRTLGAKGIATHSWKESPNGSSGKYLRRLGFESIAEHPLYWNKIDYTCTRCGKPCVCSAEEMYYDLMATSLSGKTATGSLTKG